jgi:hypothetical protein
MTIAKPFSFDAVENDFFKYSFLNFFWKRIVFWFILKKSKRWSSKGTNNQYLYFTFDLNTMGRLSTFANGVSLKDIVDILKENSDAKIRIMDNGWNL